MSSTTNDNLLPMTFTSTDAPLPTTPLRLIPTIHITSPEDKPLPSPPSTSSAPTTPFKARAAAAMLKPIITAFPKRMITKVTVLPGLSPTPSTMPFTTAPTPSITAPTTVPPPTVSTITTTQPTQPTSTSTTSASTTSTLTTLTSTKTNPPNVLHLAQAQLFTTYSIPLTNLTEFNKFFCVFLTVWNALSPSQRLVFASEARRIRDEQGVNPEEVARGIMRACERRERRAYQGYAMDEERDEDLVRKIGVFPFNVADEVGTCVKRLREARGEKALKFRTGCWNARKRTRTYEDALHDWGFAHVRCDPIGKAEAAREMAEFKRRLSV